MNFTNNDKSDYRIANSQLPLQPLQTSNDTLLNMDTKTDLSSDPDNSSSSSSINNFNNGNLATNPINSTNSRFATIQSSPGLEDSTNTVSIASLNVRGISSSTKFDTILEDLMRRSFSAVGLQETKIKESTGISLYKNFSKRSANANLYKTYWDFDPLDASAGVGLIIASYISKYVQRIHRKNGRFIAIDLFLPAKKLKIINIYAHQARSEERRVGKECRSRW